MRAFSAFTQRTIRPITRLVAWPAAEPAEGPWADALVDPGPGQARVVRLAPAEHGTALREARERLEDEAAAGELADPARVDAALAGLSALDLSPPSGTATPAFDATEARFATRSPSEAEAELSRLTRSGLRVVVTFARRGDLSRALARMERVRPAELAAGELPAPGSVGMTILPLKGGFVSRDLGLALIPEERILRRRAPSAQRGPVVGPPPGQLPRPAGRRPRGARGPRHRPADRLRDPHRGRASPATTSRSPSPTATASTCPTTSSTGSRATSAPTARRRPSPSWGARPGTA